MRTMMIKLLPVLSILWASSATHALAQAPDARSSAPDPPGLVVASEQQPPPPPESPRGDRPPPPDAPGEPDEWRPLDQPREPQPPGRFDRLPRRPGPAVEPLLRMIAQRRPELAERLERLARRDPERFHDVLMRALMVRLEDTLNEAESHPDQPPQRPGMRPDGPRQPGRQQPGMQREPGERGPDERVEELRVRHRELEEQHDQLERQSHELAERVRELRAQDGPAEERHRLHDELTAVVNEQFEVRSRLRHFEQERIEHELRRLQEALEHMQRQLERREGERTSIVERRINQLVGDDPSGW